MNFAAVKLFFGARAASVRVGQLHDVNAAKRYSINVVQLLFDPEAHQPDRLR